VRFALRRTSAWAGWGAILKGTCWISSIFRWLPTLGIDDFHPSDVMRVVAGVESLNGLVLLAATSAGVQGSACGGTSF
jgi:hypothetical protein